ncbi:MAG TPA: pitrilysin family protein [Spirochaetota bacterium]|nr:pitrilysin family protein [Spirochaetota bacterium]
MKKIFRAAVLLTIFLTPVLVTGKSHFNLPQIKTVNAHGVKVFYIQDSLPQCLVYVSMGAGSLYEDASNAGISQMLALVLSLGGSKKYPGINQYMDSIGGRYAVNASFEDITITMRVHVSEAETMLAMLTDLIVQPDINDKWLAMARSLLLEQIKQKQDNPMELAFEKARQCVFGNTGYGSVMTPESLAAINTTSLIDYWKRIIAKKNVCIGIVTQLRYDDVKSGINGLTGAFPDGDSYDYSVDIQTAVKNISSKTIYFIEKDIPQSTIVMATIAPKIKDPNRYALEVGNYIFGGGSFNSRLMNEIRVKRGYSYATGSIMRFRKNTGLFLAYAQTQAATTWPTVELMETLFHEFGSSGPVDEEVRWAKDAMIKSYIFTFDSLRSITGYYLWLDYNGLPETYINEYPDALAKVSREQVSRAWVNTMKGYVIVIVGNKQVKEHIENELGKNRVVIINQ